MVNEQVIKQNIHTSLENTKQEWGDHLSGKKKNVILRVAWELHTERSQRAQQVLVWIEEALQTDSLEGYQKLFQKWNGDPDLNKYNAENDAGANLSAFRDYLDEWVNPAKPEITPEQQTKLDNYDKLEEVKEEAAKGLGEKAQGKSPEEIKQLIQQENSKNQQNKTKINKEFPGLLDSEGKVDDNRLSGIKKEVEKVKPLEEVIREAGIDPQNENAKKEAATLKKAIKDLEEAGIKKEKVKESINKYNESIESISEEYLEQIQAEIKKL